MQRTFRLSGFTSTKVISEDESKVQVKLPLTGDACCVAPEYPSKHLVTVTKALDVLSSKNMPTLSSELLRRKTKMLCRPKGKLFCLRPERDNSNQNGLNKMDFTGVD